LGEVVLDKAAAGAGGSGGDVGGGAHPLAVVGKAPCFDREAYVAHDEAYPVAADAAWHRQPFYTLLASRVAGDLRQRYLPQSALASFCAAERGDEPLPRPEGPIQNQELGRYFRFYDSLRRAYVPTHELRFHFHEDASE
jgi:hypothetical protein